MNKNSQALLSATLVTLLGAGIAIAGSQHGSVISGKVPVFAVIVALVFIIQWLAFIHSWTKKTEKYYDLTGSLTYVSLTIVALILSPNLDVRAWVLGTIVIIWAARLGTYLFSRIQKTGGDDRFEPFMDDWRKLFNVWTIQALWITCTALAAWICITSAERTSFGIISTVGVAIWLVGFIFEAIADKQKSAFRANSANKGEFIRDGIWSISRHPNYFGEIMMWTGALVIAAPALVGWQWIAVISPLFVATLLIKVSGIPLLEKKADKRWGGRADYEEYKRKTAVLIPFIW